MGTIDSRLLKVMDIANPNVPLPIIIRLSSKPDQNAIREIQSNGVKTTFISTILPTISGQALPDVIKRVSNLPYVVSVGYDEPISAFQFEFAEEVAIPLSESSAYIGASKLNDLGITGKGVKIAIIDTGCNRNHPMLAGANIEQVNIAGGDINDGHGHGTHVASTAAGRPVVAKTKFGQFNLKGMAPEADILAIKVLDDSGSGQTSFILQGIEVAIQKKADVINLSLGSLFDNAGLDDSSKYIDEAAYTHNVMCAVAAGNSFVNFSIGSPGGARGAITVSSVDIHTTPPIVSFFSSKGPTSDARVKPNISAPGGNVTGVGKQGILAATSGDLAKEAGEPYISIAGTSMATPHVAGCLALLIQAGMQKDRDFVEQLLSKTAMYGHLKNIFDGWGVIDVYNAYKNLNMQKDSGISFLEHIANTTIFPMMAFPKSEQAQSNSIVRLPYIK